VRGRDEDDYREYVAARLDGWRRTAYLLCHDWHLADDLVSITAGKLYRYWNRVRQVERLDAYVGRMLVNTWQDEARRSSRRDLAFGVDADAPAPPGPDVVERLTQLELLRRLPPRQRAAVVLRYYDDLSVQETAAALGCTEGTVKSLSSRGLQSLRALAGRTTEENP
jgi:RNA polymerase sigma-70 factor (sigma-E family)